MDIYLCSLCSLKLEDENFWIIGLIVFGILFWLFCCENFIELLCLLKIKEDVIGENGKFFLFI